MLTKEELKKLRNQITLNSVFVSDYENNMGIDPKVVSSFFEGYISYLDEILKEEHPDVKGDSYWDMLFKYDNEENLEKWYDCFIEDPLPRLVERFIPAIEAQDYTVEHECGRDYRFGKYSPAGQDFSFVIDIGDSVEEMLSNIYKYHSNFDVSEEAYLWLDNTGHGKNGAPYDMRDVYDDMVACETFILELAQIIEKENNE